MRSRWVWLSVAIGAALTGAETAAACEGGTLLLEDSFADYQPAWGEPNDEQSVEDGMFVLRPFANVIHWVEHAEPLSGDIDVCATLTSIEALDPEESFLGLMFWYVDNDNFHALEIDAAGHASAWWRIEDDQWRSPVPWRETGLLEPGDGISHRLRVVTDGDEVTLYLNGEVFDTFTGTAPDEFRIGVIAASPPSGAATFSFSDLEATVPN